MMEQSFFKRLEVGRPKLAAKARLQTDKVSGEPVLLYPEGVVLLNGPSAAITRLCDGTRSFATILAELAELYHTMPGELEADVSEYLFNLHQQALLEIAGEQESEL
ncbi:MAG TPA: pyrroloquinoline quinone biosynthesis peptide chaperone PqqD [Ktedonobacteraceae bacterium]